MTTPLADSHAHEYALHALELLITAKTMLSHAHSECSLEPTPDEIELIEAVRAAQLEVHKVIFRVGRMMDRAAIPDNITNLIYPREAGALLKELSQEPKITIFDRD
jgi:hypothetical protein